ncbi:T9SS type A sorting domain-containing protein [Epilithonimonas sp. UC225_85]|uniref:T9SS type A sorting domain-containing protein n=1 Tax=Epilithonimonas sp. UC225_85 TaxID=3350167 RepID=UPI0036D3EAAA
MRKLFLLFFGVLSIILSAQDGSVDLNFNTGVGPNGYNIMAMGLQTDGKIIVAGDFTSYDGVARKGIARLNSDGGIDQTFNPGSGIVGRILNLIIQQDGKIIITGDFTQFNNIQKNYIARLNVDGTLDTSFNIAGSGPSNAVYSIAQQIDGRILIAGDFGSYNGISRGRVTRLNSDGTLDQTFDSGIGSNNYLNSVVLQYDGKVLIGGYTSTYNNISRRTIARLNSDGSLDTSFNPIGSGGNIPIYTMTVQPDGKVIICGGFTSFNNVETGGIARLNTDGSLDTTFVKNNSASANSAIVLPNGKILTNGNFYSTSKFHRLKADGSIDKLFDTGGEVRRMILQPDGKILVCGYFNSFNGISKKQIVRINGEDLLSVSDIEKENIQIYPNPVKDILNIKSDETISDYEIYSLDGRKLTTGNKINDSKIDVSHLTKGNYLLKVKTKEKEQTTKFIKE